MAVEEDDVELVSAEKIVSEVLVEEELEMEVEELTDQVEVGVLVGVCLLPQVVAGSLVFLAAFLCAFSEKKDTKL